MDYFENFLIIWTDYLKYRAQLRNFDLESIETILRYSSERYFDNKTRRMVVVGKHGKRLVLIPYEQKKNTITPIRFMQQPDNK